MEVVEDIDPEALPGTTSDDHLAGARKFEQIGQDAWSKLLDTTLNGLEVEPNTSILMFDGNLGVGNSFGAFMEKKEHNCPMFYVGFGDNEVTKDWFLNTKADNLTLDHSEGKVEFADVACVTENAAPNSIADKPTLPKLNVVLPPGPSGLWPRIRSKVMEDGLGNNLCSALCA